MAVARKSGSSLLGETNGGVGGGNEAGGGSGGGVKRHANLIPLNEKFPYGMKPVHGVNIGGWLLLEPFIKPSMFTQFPPEAKVVDEWTFCQKLGRDECRKAMREHFETFVTEDDFRKVADLGLDHVRIPVGYWALDVQGDEPYVQDSWEYLVRGLDWARKYGLRVMIELHTAPGSQNGWNHSGREGTVGWLDGTAKGLAHGERTLRIMQRLLEFVVQPRYSDVVTLFGVLNEPFAAKVGLDKVKQWTKDAYALARSTTKNVKGAGPILVVHEGFAGLSKWQGEMPAHKYDRVVLDVHNYFIFDRYLVGLDMPGKLNLTCTTWQHDIRASEEKFGPTMVGEFSVATDDCAQFLNGVGKGARWDGTYQGSEPAHPGATCAGRTDVKAWSPEYIGFLRQFSEKQMDSFEKGGGFGWFYWNFKTENGVNPQWDYFLGVEKGWLPPNPSNRTNHCDVWPANVSVQRHPIM
ncbi:glycoside hydrolase superfamily [Syncephalis plumigaleata]|nr:glycoside hydrolase superfamily [Syncephalis plumigaleata]